MVFYSFDNIILIAFRCTRDDDGGRTCNNSLLYIGTRVPREMGEELNNSSRRGAQKKHFHRFGAIGLRRRNIVLYASTVRPSFASCSLPVTL